MNLYEALLLQKILLQAKEERLPGSVAVKVVKLNKEIESEREALFEVMQKRWEEDYGSDFNSADTDTKEKMNQEFVKEALEVKVNPVNMISMEDVDRFTLTITEAQLIIDMIGE